MSIARISTLAALLLALLAALITQMAPSGPATALAATGLPGGMSAMLFGDRLVRLALSIAIFASTFGLITFLCHLAMVARPLARTAQTLLDKGAHGAVVSGEECLSAISDLTGMRHQLAPLRLQLATASLQEVGAASLSEPAHQLVPANALADRVVPAWLCRVVIVLASVSALLLLIWSVSTGASAQAVAMLDPNVGHPAGVLIGARSGGMAFVLASIGALACYCLATAGYGLSLAGAHRLLSALDAVTGRRSRQNLALSSDTDFLALGNALPDDGLTKGIQGALEELVLLQKAQISSFEATALSSTASLKSISGALDGVKSSLVQEPQVAPSRYTDLVVENQQLQQEIVRALSELRLTLESLQNHWSAQQAYPMPMAAHPEVAQRLSSAIKSLQSATDLRSSAG